MNLERRRGRVKETDKRLRGRKCGERTIFVCANGDGVGWGPVPHRCPSQYPDAVLSPAFELVEQESSVGQFGDGGLGVTAARLHKLQFVVHDIAVGALCRRGQPAHPNRRWTYRHPGYVVRRRSGDYIHVAERPVSNFTHNKPASHSAGRSFTSIIKKLVCYSQSAFEWCFCYRNYTLSSVGSNTNTLLSYKTLFNSNSKY